MVGNKRCIFWNPRNDKDGQGLLDFSGRNGDADNEGRNANVAGKMGRISKVSFSDTVLRGSKSHVRFYSDE